MRRGWCLLLAALLGAGPGPAQDPGQIERRQKQLGEYAAAHPARESTGMVALTDLGEGSYRGEPGGLYPGGRNTPPDAHRSGGVAMAKQIVPLDAGGRAAAAGKVVMISTGMSNTTQESQAFVKRLAGAGGIDPHFVFVDCAQGGQVAAVTARPEANYWKVSEERLTAAGVTARQVQAAWLKQANPGPTAAFPQEAKELQADLAATLHNLLDKYPNLKIVYLSSRIYAGYAASPLNPEPHAYESAFAVKWLIADQIAGRPELNYEAAKGPVRSPWLAWGPYLWADGVKGRADGLTWVREDVGDDGTHPSPAGREKVAKLLLDFLRQEATARGWFTATR